MKMQYKNLQNSTKLVLKNIAYNNNIINTNIILQQNIF